PHAGVHLGHAERAGEHAVVARDATRLAGRVHDAVGRALDRVGRTDLGAGRCVAVHADDRRRLRRARAIEIVELDHRLAAVRVALRAGLHAGLAADAAARVDEELHDRGLRHRGTYCCGSSSPTHAGGPAARRRRAAQALYSGIFEIGSCAAIVSWLAL